MTEVMHCPRCYVTMEVSDDDPDATQSEMLEHLHVRHAGYNRHAALALLAQVHITRED